MQCERLVKLIKTWYLNVQDETMAPARMVQFIKNHAANCPVCRQDPDLKAEIEQIAALVLPETKIPKAARAKNEPAAAPKEPRSQENSHKNDDAEASEPVK
jgi:hypothetical protein